MKMKRILAFILAALMLVGLMACGGGTTNNDKGDTSSDGGNAASSSGSEPDKQEGAGDGVAAEGLVVSIATAPETLDPQLNSSSDGGTYLVHLGEGLYRWNWAGGGVEPGIAKSVEESTDANGNLVLTFTLRDDALWSDGQPVTAADFEYSYKRLVNPETVAPYAEDMGSFLLNGAAIAEDKMSVDELGVKAIDEKTLQVTFEGYCSFYDEILAFATFTPVRQDIIEQYGDAWVRKPETYISTGPYKMVEFSPEEYLIMEVNDNYYDKDKLVAKKITWQFLDDDAGLVAYQTGEISLRRSFPAAEKAAMEAQGAVYMAPTLGTYYVSFNTQEAPFDDVNVRKALALAIDRKYIADVVTEGTFLEAEAYVGGGFTDENGKGFRSTSNTVAYFSDANYAAQIEEAKAALAAAGYPNGEGFPTVEYMYNTGASHELIAQAMQNMWQENLGIKVNLVNQEWNVFLQTRRDGRFQLARNGWVSDYNDPLSLLALFVSTSGNNDGNYSNPEYDALISTAMTSSDNAERMQAMRDAEDTLISKDWGCAPVLYYSQRYLIDPNLKDWVVLPVGYEMLHLAHMG